LLMPEGPWAFGASPRTCPATLVCALQWAASQSPTKRLASYFEEPYPASSMVEVSALIDPRLLIEVEAVAVIE
jgi:hypothetical protein